MIYFTKSAADAELHSGTKQSDAVASSLIVPANIPYLVRKTDGVRPADSRLMDNPIVYLAILFDHGDAMFSTILL